MADTDLVSKQNEFLADLPGPDTDMTAWLSRSEAVALVRKTFAEKFTAAEFAMGLAHAKSLGADPFKREVHFIKYGDNVSFPLSYHFLNKRMQAHPDYLRHRCNPVYANETFEVCDKDGYERVHHIPIVNPKDRGDLLGAYCQVWKRSVGDGPFNYVWIDLAAVNQGNAQWKKAAGWMARKCALAAAARDAFPDMFTNCYIQEEIEGGIGSVQESAVTGQLRGQGVQVATVAQVAAEVTKVSDEPKKTRTRATSKPKQNEVVEVQAEVVDTPDPLTFNLQKWDAFVTAQTPGLTPDHRDAWAVEFASRIAETIPEFSPETCGEVDLGSYLQTVMAEAPTPAPTERPDLTWEAAKAWSESIPGIIPMALGMLERKADGNVAEYVKKVTAAYGSKPGFIPSPWS